MWKNIHKCPQMQSHVFTILFISLRFCSTVTCVSRRVQNKLHRMTTEGKQNSLTLHHVWEREEKTQKKQPELHTLSYYKYAKLMSAVKTRMLRHTQKWPSTCLLHQNPDISQHICYVIVQDLCWQDKQATQLKPSASRTLTAPSMTFACL